MARGQSLSDLLQLGLLLWASEHGGKVRDQGHGVEGAAGVRRMVSGGAALWAGGVEDGGSNLAEALTMQQQLV